MLACGITWPTAFLVVGCVVAVVALLLGFMLTGSEFTFWVGDPPDDDHRDAVDR